MTQQAPSLLTVIWETLSGEGEPHPQNEGSSDEIGTVLRMVGL